MSDLTLGRWLLRAVAVLLIYLAGYYLGHRDGHAKGLELGLRIGELQCAADHGKVT